MTGDLEIEAARILVATACRCRTDEITTYAILGQMPEGLRVSTDMCCKHHLAGALHKIAEQLERQYSSEVN